METSSVTAAEVLVPPQPDRMSSSTDATADDDVKAGASSSSSSSSSSFLDPMEEFSRRLQNIISSYGSAAGLMQQQTVMELEKTKEAEDDISVTMETEVSAVMQSLNQSSSAEKQLEDLVRKYAETVIRRRRDLQFVSVLQQQCSSSSAARSELESLVLELQGYYRQLREETLQSCREDERKREEISNHFQTTLTEIQDQIQQHSNRNSKLCLENSNLTEKLENLMLQCEMREQSLEKINKHRDLQHKLTEAKLQQANALLAEAEEKHKREKEYLLREAIDKTKKCFGMKEQELSMKKKLTLYSQKFDEFQETLAKSNEIYVRFKKEMDNMSEKMKKLEKESNVWKTRFENCNKALTDMMEERAEKHKEFELFVLKIQKLEKLCQALQTERKALYGKIKEVRQANSNLPKIFTTIEPAEIPEAEGLEEPEKPELTPDEVQELQEIQEKDPVLTRDMARLKEEQAKLQEFAAALLATPVEDTKEESEDLDFEEDIVASAFAHFETKRRAKEQEADLKPNPVESTAEEKMEKTPEELKPEAGKEEPQAEARPEEIQQESAAIPEPEKASIDPPTEQKPAAPEQSAPPVQVTEEAAAKSEAATESENTTQTTTTPKKQAPKKKKKRSTKNAS